MKEVRNPGIKTTLLAVGREPSKQSRILHCVRCQRHVKGDYPPLGLDVGPPTIAKRGGAACLKLTNGTESKVMVRDQVVSKHERLDISNNDG